MNKLSIYLSISMVTLMLGAIEAKEPAKTPNSNIELQTLYSNNSALDLLPEEAKSRFIESFQYNENGQVTSFYYEDIKKLTPVEAQKILRVIGMEKETRNLYNPSLNTDEAFMYRMSPMAINDKFLIGYRCVGPGTCRAARGYACTENC